MSARQRCITAAFFASLSVGSACAQEKGFYLGAGIGSAKAKDRGNCSDVFDPTLPFSCTSNNIATGWKAFGGYEFNQYFALEGSYVDLGKFKISGSGSVAAIPATVDASFHPTGYSVDVIGMLPLAQGLAAFARVGAYRWALDAPINVSAGPQSQSSHDKAKGTSADFGVGAKFDLTRYLVGRLEYQWFKSIGNDDTGKSDVDLVSVSVVLMFD